MNTEPPMGDDLNRMLVSMKQNVLERTAGQPPRRAPRHVGVIIGLVALIGLGSASGAVALGLVPKPFAERAPVVPTVTEDPAPPVTETEAPPSTAPVVPPVKRASIPTDCRDVVPAGDYDRLFGKTPWTPTRPEAEGSDADPAPTGPAEWPLLYNTASIFCTWREALVDRTPDRGAIVIEIGTAPTAEIAEAKADFANRGYTCTDVHEGNACQQSSRDEENSIDFAMTFFARGATWINIFQANFPTNDLLGSMVDRIWK